MEQQFSSSRNIRENNIFLRSPLVKIRKFDNHFSILTCLQTGIFIKAQESFMDTFSWINFLFLNPSPSFNR